jgi:hypothetical protein
MSKLFDLSLGGEYIFKISRVHANDEKGPVKLECEVAVAVEQYPATQRASLAPKEQEKGNESDSARQKE